MFSDRMKFMFMKDLAVRSIQELQASNPGNLLVEDKKMEIFKTSSIEDLNTVLGDHNTDKDWINNFIWYRSRKLVQEIVFKI